MPGLDPTTPGTRTQGKECWANIQCPVGHFSCVCVSVLNFEMALSPKYQLIFCWRSHMSKSVRLTMNAAREEARVPYECNWGWRWSGTWRQGGAGCLRASVVPVDRVGDCMTLTHFTRSASLQALEGGCGT